MDVRNTINTMLVSTFHEILELEEKAIITDEFRDISNNDMHIIEAIGLGSGTRMSVIARRLNITVGSLTTSMNSLVNKGYVARQRSERDRRVVNIYLLDKGIAAYKHHEKFHQEMTDALMSCLTSEEQVVWVKSLDKITEFFRSHNGKKPISESSQENIRQLDVI
ncbi:MAG: MarR family transcriptional regulator [Lachnospiraceae bacterium]|nr:MarR family transcriptional regulator [Lachnospiraceae bacterium]